MQLGFAKTLTYLFCVTLVNESHEDALFYFLHYCHCLVTDKVCPGND